ncbi:MAG: hypothetical protein M3P49_11495, partial [Actinomycetota bacterium]|nr:hypothetical protein [Actinomycetota bacterium]
MMRRFANDETGMTMGLTVIMIVLIGVMGAGLLTFVQRDLEAVVEVNQGQKGLEMADAGVEAGKRQILFDSEPASYDGGATTDSNWSSTGSGKTLNLGNDRVNVK